MEKPLSDEQIIRLKWDFYISKRRNSFITSAAQMMKARRIHAKLDARQNRTCVLQSVYICPQQRCCKNSLKFYIKRVEDVVMDAA